MRTLALIVPLVMLLAACGGTADHHDHDHSHNGAPASPDASVQEGVTPYPLDICLVMDVPLDSMGGAHTLVHEGQEWKFCCGGCVSTFQADPEHWQERLQTAVAEQQ